ncbi:MAG: hypothetical protein K2O81_05815, partial [Clostridia bacterium]|nr:hypothetical protein [Clostridia bacterium]
MMFIKKKKCLITILAAIFAAVFMCVGITLLTPETQTAQAVSIESGNFRIYDNSGSFIEGHEDISSAWYAARGISFDIRGVATVKMFEDATISDTLSVNSRNIHIALDLNGHKLSIDSEGKSVISSYGLFTLKDSNPNATNTVISYARGNSPQTVTVSGGVITGAYGNAAVLIGTGGCSMEGGTIAGNVTTSRYSAALHVGNSFDLTGGTITENLNVAGGGGGMFAQGININISGAVKIDGNSSCTDINDIERNAGNFYFDYNATLVVNGALNDGDGNNARIGVTCGSDYPYGAEITKDYLTYHSGVAPDTYFYSDTPDKCTQLARNEVYIY